MTINNPISLICEALASPAPTITWMKDGSPFEASNNIQLLPGEARCGEERGGGARGRNCRTGVRPAGDPGPSPSAGTRGLQILNAQKEDAGQYTCVVTNALGEAMKNYHVEVLGEPGPPGLWPHGWACGHSRALGTLGALGALGPRLTGRTGHPRCCGGAHLLGQSPGSQAGCVIPR